MIALCIIVVLALLILILPVGVDVSWLSRRFLLRVKAGPVRVQLFPPKAKKPKKPKEKREKQPKAAKGHETEKEKLTPDDIVELSKLAMGALGRFRQCLSVDLLMLHLTAAAEDPYDAVMLYGRVNAALGTLRAPVQRLLKIRSEDIQTAVDFDRSVPAIDARLVATIQIWEILYIGICAGLAFLRWWLKRKKRRKVKQKLLAQSA